MRLLILLLLLSHIAHSTIAQGIDHSQETQSEIRTFNLGFIEDFHSTILSEDRTLNIYLPEGFNQSDTTTYPVVYLLDGSADEDYIHVVGLYQFNTFPWINRMPKSIVVGIANVDRVRDYSFPTTIDSVARKYPTHGHSDNFIKFIETELQPYIQTKYKTRDSKTIIGQSLGGLLATEILLKKPSLFDKYIIVSPSLWWSNYSILDLNSELFDKAFSRKLQIYIGSGKEGLTPGSDNRTGEDDSKILAEKIKATNNKSLRVYFDLMPEEDHATVEHLAIYNALIWLK